MNRSLWTSSAWGPLVVLAASLGVAPAQAAPPSVEPTVAVLYFNYEGKDPQMAMLKKGIAQMLISDLSFNERFRIVERDRLQDLVEELELNQTAKIDPKTANKMGKLLGARYIIMGGYFDLFGSLRIDARVVEVQTGKIVRSIGGHASPAAFLNLEQKVAKQVDQVLSTKLEPFARPAKTKTRPKPPKKLDVKTAVEYSSALDALDKNDKKTAAKKMKAVLKAQPDFKLAELDLAQLVE